MKRLIKILWLILQRFGHLIGTINSSILMSLSFYGLLLPAALVRRLFRRSTVSPGWSDKPPLSRTHFEKQY